MKRTFVALFVLMALLASLLGSTTPATAAGVTIYFEAPIYTEVGQTVTANVRINTDEPILGWQIDVYYDGTKVRLNNWTEDESWFKAQFLAKFPIGDTFRVAGFGAINSNSGFLQGATVAGLGYLPGQGAEGDGRIANINFLAQANGRVNLTFGDVCIVRTNNTCIPGVVKTPSFIQIGPAPIVSVSSIVFSPTGAAGQEFKATVSVANTAAAAYPGGDPLNWSITNATGGAPASPITLPAIGANSSYTFEITGLLLNTGAQNAVMTVSVPAFSSSRNATYSPVSDSGQTIVDATFGAFIDITPDTNINFGALALGANSKAGNLNVKCNTSYQVDVYDNTNAWKMTEFNGTTYGARKLSESLSVASAQRTVTAGTPAMLVSGGVAGQVGDAGQNFPLTYSQSLRYSDPLLPAGSMYRTVLLYNGYVTL